MSKRCPESGELVTYLDCKECENKKCEKEINHNNFVSFGNLVAGDIFKYTDNYYLKILYNSTEYLAVDIATGKTVKFLPDTVVNLFNNAKEIINALLNYY